MKTVCLLNNKVIMSQDGDAVEAMTQNAEQYAGAIVEVVSDEEFNNLINTNETKIALCKTTAKAKLAASDWSVLPDVQITNKSAFDNYRAILRGYVISPVTDPTWPTEPQPVWS